MLLSVNILSLNFEFAYTSKLIIVEKIHWISFVCFVVLMTKFNTLNAHEITGFLAGEGRYFFAKPLFSEQADHNASLAGNFEYYHDWDSYRQRFAFTAFARLDSEDDERSHGDIRELYWWQQFSAFEMYVGLRKIFWGVTESLHLVDIINQDDVLENIDREEKLGQPMLQFVTEQNWGTLSAFLLPYFREQQFPGAEGRLRVGLPILDDPLYQSGAEEKHIDYALRWSHVVGNWDIGLSHFVGTHRDPVFVPEFTSDGSVALRPQYNQIEQSGLDAQATIEDWLLKLEAISIRERGQGRNTAAIGGFEYTLVGLGETAMDLGILMEYQFDDRSGERSTVSQNDLVVGCRWVLNDVDGTEILTIFSQDLDADNQFFSLEASRRLNDFWTLEGEIRLFSRLEAGTPEFDLRQDDYFQLEVKRYF